MKLLTVSLNQWHGDYKEIVIKIVSLHHINRPSLSNLNKTLRHCSPIFLISSSSIVSKSVLYDKLCYMNKKISLPFIWNVTGNNNTDVRSCIYILFKFLSTFGLQSRSHRQGIYATDINKIFQDNDCEIEIESTMKFR